MSNHVYLSGQPTQQQKDAWLDSVTKWMSEKKTPVFIHDSVQSVMQSEDRINRKGRFDKIFFEASPRCELPIYD